MKCQSKESLRQRNLYGLDTERLLAHLLANTKAGVPLSSGLEKSQQDGTWEAVHAIDTVDIERACYYRVQPCNTKPWFYNIPAGGVLCWVEEPCHCVLITSWEAEVHVFTDTMGNDWDNQIPKPLTGNQVEVFLRSARLIETGQM